jgi:hypothetical protein
MNLNHIAEKIIRNTMNQDISRAVGVFVREEGDRVEIVSANSKEFDVLIENRIDDLIGVYDANIKSDDIMDDLVYCGLIESNGKRECEMNV